MKKENGYKTEEIVAQAKEDCGCPEDKFFACAQKFGQVKEIVSHAGHPAVTSFANWVTQRTAREIANRMACRRDSR